MLKNLKHWQSSLIGYGIIAVGLWLIFLGKITAAEFGVMVTVAAFPILGLGKKKKDEV